jgi:hypothetical protein
MEYRWLGVTLMGLSRCSPQNLRHVGNSTCFRNVVLNIFIFKHWKWSKYYRIRRYTILARSHLYTLHYSQIKQTFNPLGVTLLVILNFRCVIQCFSVKREEYFMYSNDLFLLYLYHKFCVLNSSVTYNAKTQPIKAHANSWRTNNTSCRISRKGLLIVVASRSHSDTLHSAGLLWMSDQPDP